MASMAVARGIHCELQRVPPRVGPTTTGGETSNQVKVVLQPRVCTLRSYASDRGDVMRTTTGMRPISKGEISDGIGVEQVQELELSPFLENLYDYIESSKKSHDFEIITGRLAMMIFAATVGVELTTGNSVFKKMDIQGLTEALGGCLAAVACAATFAYSSSARKKVLPLVPPGRKANEEGSPYSGQDANCGNTLLISLEELVKDGLLKDDELPTPVNADRVNFDTVAEIKDPLVANAAERLIRSEGKLKDELQNFRRDPRVISWLEDAAYFAAIDSIFNTLSWYDWPEPLKNRHLSALEEINQSKKDFIDIFIAQQFLFQRQWQKIRDYAQLKGIKIMGDMPIYVGYHSADVWANKKQFLLNRKGFPLLVSGVPPDAFSETGQLWGSPLYNWKEMEKDRFTWWTRRIQRAMDMYDEFRIDHFRGFAGFWAVPSEAKIATIGQWKAGPGKLLFDAIFRAVGKIDIIAEDLGVITDDVVELRKSIGAPGMAVLQFGFGSDAENPHLPHNHEKNQVVYTGTHDNDTVQGWWDSLKQEEKHHVRRYLSLTEDDDISWELIQGAASSVARTAIVPMQDILGLGSSARMNTPATQFGNWNWTIPASVSFESLDTEASRLQNLLSVYGRLQI